MLTAHYRQKAERKSNKLNIDNSFITKKIIHYVRRTKRKSI